MNSALKFAFGSLLLGSLAYGQATPSAASGAASSMVSPEPSGIKPIQIVPADATDADFEMVADPASLLPDLPPLPGAKSTLVGGTIARLDRVRDQLTVRIFGGGQMKVLFDPRTRVYRGGREASVSDLEVGGRVYLDTILDGKTIFARSIRLKTAPGLGETQGIVESYSSDRSEMTIRDAISPTPVRVRLSSSTRFLQAEKTVSAAMLTTGTLVAVKFNAEGNGHDVAREISILALPGTQYTFAGQIVHLDLRTGLMVLNSSTDHKTYEVYLSPSVAPEDNLHVGALVTVVANFESSRYVARSLTIDSRSR